MVEEVGSPLPLPSAVSHVTVTSLISLKNNTHQVFYGQPEPQEPARRHRRCTWRLRWVLLLSLGLNLAILASLLALMWYKSQDVADALLSASMRSSDLSYSACETSITSLASKLHAVIGDEEEVAVRMFISEPLMVLQNHAMLDTPVESGPGAQDANLKLMFWQLHRVFHSVEGIFLADASGLYARYDRVTHRDDQPAHGHSFTMDYVPGEEVNSSLFQWSCPLRCPPVNSLRPLERSVYSLSQDGLPLTLLGRSPKDVRKTLWYKAALEAQGEVIWDGPRNCGGTLCYRLVQARFEGQNLKIMAGADFTLTHLSRFLRNTEMARFGLVFIIDRAGRIISSSVPFGNETFDADSEHLVPIWHNVQHRVVHAVSSDLVRRWGLDSVSTSEGVQFLDEDNRRYIYSTRKMQSGHGKLGAEWIVVNVQPLTFYNGRYEEMKENNKGYLNTAVEDLRVRLDRSLIMTLLVSLIFLMVELAISCSLGQAITVQLKKLQNDMRAVARLDFEGMTTFSPSMMIADIETGETQVDTSSCHSRSCGEADQSCVQEIVDIRDSFTSMTAGLQSFARYMDPSLVRMLVHSKRQARLGVAKANVTIFFSDIMDFTVMAESMRQETFMCMLGDYLDSMSNIIMSNNGVVGEFIGDAIMAWWNAPEDLGEGHTVKALRAALEQQHCLGRLRERWAAEGLPQMRARMGLAAGEVLAGNIGSNQRMKYGLVGDTVNLASRLESLCKRYGVDIIIDDVASRAPGVRETFLLRPLGEVTVRGRTQSTELFELVGLQGDIPGNAELESFCDGFSAAQALYRMGAFAETLELLSGYALRWPSDRPTTMLKQRCEDLIAAPPGPDWSPVEGLTEK